MRTDILVSENNTDKIKNYKNIICITYLNTSGIKDKNISADLQYESTCLIRERWLSMMCVQGTKYLRTSSNMTSSQFKSKTVSIKASVEIQT